MKEVTFSSMVQPRCLDLQGFEERTMIHPVQTQLNWVTGWNQILQYSLYQKGPDISEVGSTWLENLRDMRAVRPLSTSELHALGGEGAFLPAAWPPVNDTEEVQRVYSIPWLLDTRLVCYRRDLLAKAGVSAQAAFSRPEAMYHALERLRASGVEYPLVLATGGLSIHNLASWVWGRGGHFRSPDYHKVALVEPEARRGMHDYFSLHAFIDPKARGFDYGGADQYYNAGNGAVLLSGNWEMAILKRSRVQDIQVEPVVRENTGFAMPPGVPYIGATHLVIWRHTLNDQPALQLLDHLTTREVQNAMFSETGNFPARLSLLNGAPYATDPDYRVIVDCMRKGRGFRSARLWAGVEMRLNTLHDQLWNDLFSNPDMDLDAEIERRVRDLAVRLEKTLLANW